MNQDATFPFADLLGDFFAECDEHLTTARRILLVIEGSVAPIERQKLDDLLRSLHSIKGLCGMVGLSAAEHLAHQIEACLQALNQGQVMLLPAVSDALLDGLAMLDQVIAAFRQQQPAPDTAPALARLAALLPGPDAASSALPSARQLQPGAPNWRFRFVPSSALSAHGITVASTRALLQQIGDVISVEPRTHGPGGIMFEFLVATSADAARFAGWQERGLSWEPCGVDLPTPPPLSQPLVPLSMVRVDTGRLDTLLNLAGDLVVSRGQLDEQLVQMASGAVPIELRPLQDLSTTLGRQIRRLRTAIVQLRAVPLGELFERMQLVVRDLAHQQQKQVTLVSSGTDTTADKFIVERLFEPLMHLVRNAVSHGLEPPEQRSARGKPTVGTITLHAATNGDQVLIEIVDDGNGIDAAQVFAYARQIGLLSPAEWPAADDTTTLLDLLCAPGFSTRTHADHASGRGVGLAAVRRAVHELGGTLDLATEPGHGSSFYIQVPLTLSIVDAILVAVGDQPFAAPLPLLEAVFLVQPDAVTTLEQNQMILHHGDPLPLLSLARHFGLPAHNNSGVALLTNIVGQRVVLLADRLLGKREIVVRPLADPLAQVAGVSGAADLGNGQVVLVLDPSLRPLAAMATTPGSANQVRDAMPLQQRTETFVLFSLAGAIYGLHSQAVDHIAMVEQITPLPNAPACIDGVVATRGQIIPALSLRVCFGFERQPYDLRSRLLVVRQGSRVVGLLVDAAREFARIPAESIQPPPNLAGELSGDYLEGVALVGERLVLVLRLDEVVKIADALQAQTASAEQDADGN